MVDYYETESEKSEGRHVGTVRAKMPDDYDFPRDKPRGGIQGQLANLEDQIQKTAALFTELQMKIEPILIPQPEEADSPMVDRNEKTSVRGSDLNQTIVHLDDRIRRLQHHIALTNERVEL